jgi:hypothetical protein
VAMASGDRDNLGMVLLISGATRLSHVAALLRRFGFEVHELAGIPTPPLMADSQRCEVQLVIVEEALCTGAEVDPVALLLGMLSLASILIVRGATSRGDERTAASDRCRYLAPSFSPFDLTLAIVDLLKRRRARAN